MLVVSGQHAGQTTEKLILKRPDWAQWMVENYPDYPVSRSIRELVDKLDRKKFKVKCAGCGRRATRASAYSNTGHLMFWCDDCDPYGSGARDGKLTVVRTFHDALRHVDFTCDGRRGEKRGIIRQLAQGKGLQSYVSEAHAAEFFGVPSALNRRLPTPSAEARRQEEEEDEEEKAQRQEEQKQLREARRRAKFPKPPPGKGFDVCK